MFQSSFELTGYITVKNSVRGLLLLLFQSSFELTGYITKFGVNNNIAEPVSKLFRAYGLYNTLEKWGVESGVHRFQSSFELTGYITKSF